MDLCAPGSDRLFRWGSGGCRLWWFLGLGFRGGGPSGGCAVLTGRGRAARWPWPCGRRGCRGAAFDGSEYWPG